MKYGFVYIWFDKKRKMYYIGSHWGKEDDGYICSSTRMRNAYKRRPEDFKRRILETQIDDRKLMFEQEENWLQKAEKRKQRYYNLHFTTGHWSTESNKFLTVTEKLREANIRRFSDPEARKKHSEITRLLWQDPEYRKKQEGKHKHSEATKQKISIAQIGRKTSEETKKKLSERGKAFYASELGDARKRKISIKQLGNKHAKMNEEQKMIRAELTRKQWQDPVFRAKRIANKLAKYE